MKQFLCKTSIFVGLGLLICITLELLLMTLPNDYKYKNRYVQEHKDDIKILVLGHSHATYNIVPELMNDSLFILAISGRVHYYDAVLAERYVPKLKNLECVIWTLGYNFQYMSYLYPCRKDNKEDWNSFAPHQCRYEKYMGISYERRFPFWHWSEVLQSNTRYFTRFFKGDSLDCTSTGHQIAIRHTSGDFWKREELPPEINYNSPYAPLAKEEGLTDMKRIAEVCRKAAVRLVVITTPCYETYRERMTDRGKREMQECVDAMRSVYPEMEYYNFMTDPRFTEDDFYDASHLLEEAAERFSKILKDTLNL